MTIARKKTRKANNESAKTKHPESSLSAREGKKFLPRDAGEHLGCPLCNKHLKLIRVSTGAELIAVSPKTIYRYIDEGLVYGLKVAGKTYRVCKQCLLREYLDS